MDDLTKLKKKLLKNEEFRRLYEQPDPEMEIARSLIEARMKRGLTQEQLAKKVGTKQPSISKIEGGKGGFSWKFLKKIAKALDAQLSVPQFQIK